MLDNNDEGLQAAVRKTVATIAWMLQDLAQVGDKRQRMVSITQMEVKDEIGVTGQTIERVKSATGVPRQGRGRGRGRKGKGAG